MKVAVSKLSLLALVALGACLWCDVVAAQQPLRYQPTRSTISPYLNLTRRDGGALPNYYAFVRPQQRQAQINAEAESLRVQQTTAIERIETDLQTGRAPLAGTGTGSWFMIPGTRSVFRDTTRYYPQPALTPAGR